jgi:hypothetical protein
LVPNCRIIFLQCSSVCALLERLKNVNANSFVLVKKINFNFSDLLIAPPQKKKKAMFLGKLQQKIKN